MITGVEIASIGLAILPLLISAVEHYDDCIRPILRYRRIVEEIHLFQRNLQVQNTIFRNQCKLILQGSIEHEIANRMLRVGSKDPSWNDKRLEARLNEQLGVSKDACLTSVELINKKLQSITKESLDLEALVDETVHVKRALAKKLRFSFSQSRLDEFIKSLRDLNDDFIKLSNQTIQSTAHEARKYDFQHRHYEKEILGYQAVGKAAEKVYKALARACIKHSEHLAYFCVNPITESADDLTTEGVKFQIAFSRLPTEAEFELTKRSEARFPCEQGPSKEFKAQLCDESSTHRSLVETLKREFVECSSKDIPLTKKRQKTVRFQEIECNKEAIASSMSALLAVPRFQKVFCDSLRAHLGSTCPPSSCIGLLEIESGSRHRVYAPSKEVLYQKMGQTTLLNLLTSSRMQSAEAGGLLTYQKLRLAKNLVTAALQYHATPWMGTSWRSRDIFLFEKQEGKTESLNVNFSSIHVSIKVSDRYTHSGILSSKASAQSLAPNNLLFSLGVTLLELAYSSDLHTLRKPCDLENGRDARGIEFFIAKRLASDTIREMGGACSKIVKKLLQCNFGYGDDLSIPELQGLIYKDVVCELDRLEKLFQELELG